MKTPKGIFVDIVEAGSGLKPLEFEIADGTVFVRMPDYGPFNVRICAPKLTEVVVTIDGGEQAKTQVQPGKIALVTKADGSPFTFGAPGASNAAAAPVEEAAQQTLFATGEDKPATPATNGLVAISVRFVDQPATKRTPAVVGGMPHLCFFQLNPPAAHNAALADNLHRMVAPEGPTRRFCSCCQ